MLDTDHNVIVPNQENICENKTHTDGWDSKVAAISESPGCQSQSL